MAPCRVSMVSASGAAIAGRPARSSVRVQAVAQRPQENNKSPKRIQQVAAAALAAAIVAVAPALPAFADAVDDKVKVRVCNENPTAYICNKDSGKS